MRRNLRFIALLLRLKLSHMMVFRFSFFGAFFADAMLFIVQLMTFSAIYSQVDAIGSFTRGQMIIFIGTFSMINGINMLVYFFGIIEIPRKLREGALDHYITKPVSPLLRLTFENINPGSAPLLVLSALIIAYGVGVEGIAVSVPLALAYTAMVLLMTLLYYDMELILRTIPFFVISANAIDRLEGELLTLNFKIPGVLYRGGFKVLFYFILPYGVMATVPTELLSGTLSAEGLIHALAVTVIFTAFALMLWRHGLRRYKSAGS